MYLRRVGGKYTWSIPRENEWAGNWRLWAAIWRLWEANLVNITCGVSWQGGWAVCWMVFMERVWEMSWNVHIECDCVL